MSQRVNLKVVTGLVLLALMLSTAIATARGIQEQQVVPADTHFAVIGDYGSAGQGEQDVADLIHSWSPDFVITLGDNNYPSGAASTMDQNIGQYYHDYIYPYNGSYGQGAPVNRFFPALGNHDWTTTAGARPFTENFSLPNNERYYTYTEGAVQFFVVDSAVNEPNGITSTSVQGQWIRAAMAASTACWRVVYMHHPPYSSGPHGSTPALQWPFAQWGATAVLAGHDHDYERIRDPATGLPYFVNGIGGASLYPTLFTVPGSVVRFAGDFGAMRVDANTSTNSLTFRTITRGNFLVDSYQINGCTPRTPATQRNTRSTGPALRPAP